MRIERLTSRAVATIASGQALSSEIDLEGSVISSLVLPSGWDAAALTFQASADGATWGNVYDDAGTEVTVASTSVVAGRVIVNKAVLEQLAGLRRIRLRSGTSAAPINQTASRTITVLLKG